MKRKNKQQSNDTELGLRTVIEPGGKNFQYWKDIWRYRSLVSNLAKRDITVRYKQTVIGLGWSIINPIFNMILFTFVFGSVANLSSDGGAPYAVMVYAGLIPWTLFSKVFNLSSNAFLTSAGLMKKIYFPRIISPLGASLAAVVDTAISYVILLVIILITHFTSGFVPSWRIVLAPLFFIFPFTLGFFCGLFLAPASIRYRDVSHIIPFFIMAAQYITPVAYSFTVACESIPEQFRSVYALNPIAGAVNLFRWCIIPDNAFHWPSFWSMVICIIVFIPLSIYVFRKGERTFVDLV